ncbi:band 7 domain protein [Rhizoctonia solani AG-3 Rhs1AP]|uniref:Band 7 domain protein n=2 Tax=Rhizoctonia solani AG-3 TaxID=1086053 RepID=A0A074SY83_9AGAM|nr:band 7 domain protein [Rhizoctonia solani AG-3 Rhs1AP]KEP54767.1 band 7 domain protein [Rhizoctonia solani 123E]
MAHSGYSDIDATVINDAAPSSISHKGKERADVLDENAHRRNTRIGGNSNSPSFVHSEDYFATNRPFCVKIGADGLLGALTELDSQLQASGRPRLLSRKKPTEWLGFIGEEINPGEIGVPCRVTQGPYESRDLPALPVPQLVGAYLEGTRGVSDTTLFFQGLTVVQVSLNQVAVVSDPQNRIFTIRGGGFAAFAVQGTYDVLAVVDQTHLTKHVQDNVTGATLGWMQEITMPSRIEGSTSNYVVAAFLDIPANNVAVLQRGDEMEQVPAGQHCITNPNVKLRGLFTCGENQIEMPTKDIYTRDQVPVSLTIYMKWQLLEPLKLTTHGYNSPYEALRDKAQSILTQIVAHLDYSSMVKQRTVGSDHMEDPSDPSSPFLDALRTQAMDDLHVAALEYGILLKDLAVIDRQFKGDIASTMDKLTTRALQAQVEAANVDRENSNKVKQEQGALQVAQVRAEARKTEAEALAYATTTAAKAQAEAVIIAAEAQAAAIKLQAQAEADAVAARSNADSRVDDAFAREMEVRRVDVERVKAFGPRAVFVPCETGGVSGNSMSNALVTGMAMRLGHEGGAASASPGK